MNDRIVGIGLDLVHIPRVHALAERWRNRFLDRLYTDAERGYCFRQAKPYASLAGRFAAKEALLKALGTGWAKGLRWLDMQILNDFQGKPVATAQGGVATLMKRAGVTGVHISLSHDGDYAMAQVILTGNRRARGSARRRRIA